MNAKKEFNNSLNIIEGYFRTERIYILTTIYLKGSKNMDKKGFKPYKPSPVRPIFEKFSTDRDVSLVYGEPIEMHGRTIIPVPKVKYSIGGGPGHSD